MKHPATAIIPFFWSHIKPYKWYYLVMLSAPLITSFYPFAYNYAIKLFLDIMAQPGELTYNQIMFPIGLFVMAQIIMEVMWRVSAIAEWKSEPYVRRTILLDSYDYVQNHPYSFFQDNFTGTLSSKLKGILDGYDKFWAEMHHGVLLKLIIIFVSFFALALINLKIGLFMFLWTIIYMPIMYKLSLRVNACSFEETESRHSLIGQISDKLSNIISLLSFASRKRELHSLDEQVSGDFLPKQIRTYKTSFIFQIVGGILYLIMFTFLLFYMIHLRMTDQVTIGDFAFVFGIFQVVAEHIWHATVSLKDFSRAMGDLKSALSILNISHLNIDSPTAVPLVVTKAQIDFKNVNFGYTEDELTLANLNLLIKPGEKIGIVGHSGAGKTSLVHLLMRYFNCKAGNIFIDNQNIKDITQDSLREQIAVIPQDTLLFHRSLMENIRYGNPIASDEQVIEASKIAHLHDFIDQLSEGYETYVGERGLKLSGGQRQRIAIARAILKDAPILILDEATSALDSQTEKFIQEALNVLIDDKKKTVIAIAHRLSTLKHMDRIIVLDKGTIVEEGTHNQLIQKDSLYKKLWKLQEI